MLSLYPPTETWIELILGGAPDVYPSGRLASSCIEEFMRWSSRIAARFVVASIFCLVANAATSGSFRGTVVEGDKGAPTEGWLYVRGRNGSIRRVDISRATIAYDETVPAEQRKPSAREQLAIGAEVRITAEQDSDGEWRASRVEIIKPAPAGSAGSAAAEANRPG